ncbi:MAG: glycosyltransferase family 4 protein [Planctomycetaceae bacterium]|nr:glycosyltransferase family 4 protein [Planctomycetaceae bacterium]
MEILCYRNVRVPSTTAHSLYGVRSCALLSRHTPVQMIASNGHTAFSMQELYGLDLEDFPEFQIHVPPIHHKGISSVWRKQLAKSWLKQRQSKQRVVYVSQRKCARFFRQLRRNNPAAFLLLLECHDADFGDGSELLAADALIFTSESLRTEVIHRYPFVKTKPQRVYHHKINAKINAATNHKAAPNNIKRVTYAGSILPWKHLELLLQAHTILPSNFHLEIIGGSQQDAYRQQLIQDAIQLGLADRTTFTPFVPMGHLPKLAGRSDVLVATLAPQERLRMPFKLLDYLAWQRPVIAPDLPCVTELLTHGRNAFLYQSDSPNSLAEQIAAGCNLSNQERDRFIQEGKKVIRPFCEEIWATDFVAWLRSLTGESCLQSA